MDGGWAGTWVGWVGGRGAEAGAAYDGRPWTENAGCHTRRGRADAAAGAAVSSGPLHRSIAPLSMRTRISSPLPPRRRHDGRHVASRRIAGHRVGVGARLELVLEPLGRLGRLCPLQGGEQRLDLIRVRARVRARVGVRARVRVGVRVTVRARVRAAIRPSRVCAPPHRGGGRARCRPTGSGPTWAEEASRHPLRPLAPCPAGQRSTAVAGSRGTGRGG